MALKRVSSLAHSGCATRSFLPASAMVRQFKYHEQKLLKKVDFLNVRYYNTVLAFHSFTFLH